MCLRIVILSASIFWHLSGVSVPKPKGLGKDKTRGSTILAEWGGSTISLSDWARLAKEDQGSMTHVIPVQFLIRTLTEVELLRQSSLEDVFSFEYVLV
ncbi:hypothetical protein CEXT_726961 [Caerostris extrusa]|uniref:Uncharacterized protein n=1 Tax=Caerostris extrusa TaxID=172846 RepID=A0AAV4RMK0_CAEEX|nr:hypothetical protein CEXT_726961 [Caerostris extrusa]